MNSNYCKNLSSDTEHIKQRYNPTFVHQPIFASFQNQIKQPRFSQTFFSTALDTQGYNQKTQHSKSKDKNIPSPNDMRQSRAFYSNYSHQRRLQDLYPKTRVFYSSKQKWYDHSKEQYLNSFRNVHNNEALRQRKLLELASASVFIDFDYESKRLNPEVIQNKENQNLQKTQILNPKQVQSKKDAKENEYEPNSGYKEVKNQKGQKQKLDQEFYQEKKENKKIKQQNKKDSNHQKSASLTNKRTKVLKKSQSLSRTKTVCKNPVFQLVRGNKIDNYL